VRILSENFNNNFNNNFDGLQIVVVLFVTFFCDPFFVRRGILINVPARDGLYWGILGYHRLY